jgi:RNA polymerase sigma factor (sigma-70 family)
LNLYKKTEELLYSYKTLVAEIKNLQIEISEIEYIGCGAMSYEERIQSTNSFSSSVENEVINRQKQIDKIKDLLFMKQNIISKIDNALESLDERSRDIIKLKYFEKYNNSRIASRMELTDTSICCIKKEVVEKLSNIILNIT